MNSKLKIQEVLRIITVVVTLFKIWGKSECLPDQKSKQQNEDMFELTIFSHKEAYIIKKLTEEERSIVKKGHREISRINNKFNRGKTESYLKKINLRGFYNFILKDMEDRIKSLQEVERASEFFMLEKRMKLFGRKNQGEITIEFNYFAIGRRTFPF